MIKTVLANPQSKRQYNKELFRVVAPVYDRVTRLLSWGQDARWKRLMASRFPTSADIALDIACGTGDIIALLRENYVSAGIIGLDLTLPMLHGASQRFSSHGDRLPLFYCADMCATGLPDHSIDLVTGSYALRNAPDLSTALAEIHRVLKPGGTALFLDFSKSPHPILSRIQLFVLQFWGSLWGLVMHRKGSVYGYIAQSLRTFPDRAALKHLLTTHGFEVTETTTFFTGIIQLIVCRKR